MKEQPQNLPRRQKLPHRIPAWASHDAILFVTICCRPRGENHLCFDAVALPIWESIAYRQLRADWFVHLWLLMPDHLHALISFPLARDPAKVMANWKEIIAKKAGVRWQRDFFDHRLRSNESLQQKAEYIRQNPVRNGLVGRQEDWKFVWEPK